MLTDENCSSLEYHGICLCLTRKKVLKDENLSSLE
jgi:REP element-mobilizing transposase RayT